jgi:D-cysteine desulfhydrase
MPDDAPAAVRPLFSAYPALWGRVPFLELADLPTPLQRLERLSALVGAEVWAKRDGLTHPIYGGNKIRKFEFVFADVVRSRARAVLTGGGLGSHHTLATAVIARQLGLQPVCSYYCQPVTEEVHANLGRTAALGVEARFCGDYVGLAASFAWEYVRQLLRTHRPPYFIYPGASSTLGILGYVNAAFEIKRQLEEMRQPEPEAIFVAVGSCGTFAGLLLGCRLAGVGSRVIGVRIIEEQQANRAKVARLANRAARRLHGMDPTIPTLVVEPGDVELLGGYVGPGYAYPTPESLRAVELLGDCEGLPLETTYTGKAMAALLDHAGQNPGSRLLFVDSYAEAPALKLGDYHALPERFWPAFDPAAKTHCWCLRAWRDPTFCWRRSAPR